jgi:hypothetical protein
LEGTHFRFFSSIFKILIAVSEVFYQLCLYHFMG